DESAHGAERDGCIGAASEHCVQPSRLNLPHGVGHRVCRRGAAGGDHVTWAPQSKAHAQFARDTPHDSRGNTEQTHLAELAMEVEPVLLFGKFLRSATSPDDHGETASFVKR